MKIKQYFNSLVSRRKSAAKSPKSRAHHPPISSTDGHYEICTYEEPASTEQQGRTVLLLNRHAQLINTIVSIRSQQDPSCLHCRHLPSIEQQSLFLQRPYSNTLATSNPHRECPHQAYLTSSNHSLRQRSKIRTNPWITKAPLVPVERSIHSANIPAGLIHSESFPQTISTTANTIPSDSGQGFSLSSSRVIESSSTDNTSADSQRRGKRSTPTRFQRSSATRISTNPKRRPYQTRHTSPRLSKDQYSMEFEDILENERSHKQRSPRRRSSPFILPLDEMDMQVPSNFSNSLKKTNSHTILKHIAEIENEIQMIKNLNFDAEERLCFPNEQNRTAIHQQIDQWVDQCLTNSKSSIPPMAKQPTELMTAFYLTSIPAKRTVSCEEQFNPRIDSHSASRDCKPTQECPF